MSLCHYFCHFLFGREVMSNSLRPYGLQHAQLPCSLLFPTVCSDLCPLSQWCSLTISSSVIPFSSCLQTLLESGSFLMSQPFISDGQSIGASASVLQMTIQGWFPLRLTGLISLQSKGLSCQSIMSKRLKTFIYIYIYIKDCIKGLFDMESGGWQNWLKEG